MSVVEQIREMLPCRGIIMGRCGSGKTPTLVRLIAHHLRGSFDRTVVICPSFWNQSNKFTKKKTFEPLFPLVKGKRDVITDVTEENVRRMIRQIMSIHNQCEASGKKSPRTVILMDDLSGTKFYNSGRISTLSSFVVQCTHFNCSLFAITQQPTFLTPSFRDNSELIISFPSNRQQDMELLLKEYRQIGLSKKRMKEIIQTAWGDDEDSDDEEERKKKVKQSHFLTILQKPGTPIRYFIDFDYHIKAKDNGIA
jgi:hypothetical protein